jgi:drug/metabolite transporter (DMT)-like permease
MPPGGLEDARPAATPVTGGMGPGVGAATVAMVAWGFSGVLVVLTTQPALVVALERLWLGVPMVGVMLAVSRRRLDWPTLRRAIPGGVLLCGDMAMFFSAVKLTSIADATVIGALQPALVLLVAGPMFRERVPRADVMWTSLAIAGVGAVVLGASGAGSNKVAGDLLAAGALLCWTGYWLVSKHARTMPRGRTTRRDKADDERTGSATEGVLGSIEYTSAVMLIAALAMVPVTLLSGEHLTAGRPLDWLWMGLMTLVPGGAHVALNWAHRFVGVSVSSVIVSVNPVVAAGAAAVVLHQSIDFLQVMGGLVAILAVAIVASRTARGGPVEVATG